MKRPITFEQAKSRYVHRFTMQHIPAWAREVREDGSYYAPQYRSDKEWYELTKFPGEDGIPKREKFCQSNGQTWPLGKSLANPFKAELGQ